MEVFVLYIMLPLGIFGADWPVPPSIKCNSTGTFRCINAGNYEDPFDSTCKNYYVCSTYNIDLVQKQETCSGDTWYDPIKEECSSTYKCLCDKDYSFNLCEHCRQCAGSDEETVAVTTSLSDTGTSAATTESASIQPYCSLGGEFNCTQTGRFANPIDFTCRSYYYCYRWQFNGELRFYPYNCSVGLFNPNTGSCDRNYKCPCSVSTEASTSSPVETTNPFITTTSTSIDTTTAISTASTTSPSPYCSVGGVFNCTYTGRYSNPNDLTCRSYYYCYRWQSDGELRWYFYNCSVGLFNPNTGSCDPNYQCPCSVSTEASTSSPVETTNPFITTASTSIDTTTAISTASTSSPTPYCSVGGVFNCTNTGRYGNPGDLTCRSYYYCYRWQSDGELRWYFYNCSVGLFNPTTGSCDPNYQCPCSVSTEVSTSSPVEITNSFRTTTSASIDTTITTLNSITTLSSVNTASSSSTTTTVSSQPPYCSEGGVFHCTETGRFTNPNDLTCRSYYYCYRWNSGQLRSYLYNCARGLFNPNSNSCDPNYLCPCAAPLDN